MDHLILIKNYMKNIQVKYNRRILQTFNMEDIYARRAKERRKLLPEDNISRSRNWSRSRIF